MEEITLKEQREWINKIIEFRCTRFKFYSEIKSKLNDEWRERIFKRDDNKCRVCGNTINLNLAHITTTNAFVRALQPKNFSELENVMKLSYREDNLFTLCGICHKCQHEQIRSFYNEELAKLLEEKKKMKEIPEIKKYLELCERISELFKESDGKAEELRLKSQGLIRKLKKERGWDSARQIIQQGDIERKNLQT